MEVKTYRAKSMQEALQLVRHELGPEAAVLHTREVRGGSLLRWIRGTRMIEVTASNEVDIPSRLAPRPRIAPAAPPPPAEQLPAEYDFQQDAQSRFRADLKNQLNDLHSLVEDLCQKSAKSPRQEMPNSLFRLYTDLIDADVHEDLARELLERVRRDVSSEELIDPVLIKARMARMIENDIMVSGPIQISPGRRHLVALVGPTGVGKTTTIAKLAANYRLREKRRVGLITVDTYRIAAVEQLRTYADIIDLPMEVVSTPREMRQAVARMSDLDLVLMDTAGRSPRDDVKIQELKSLLAEAGPDEVHLVLSSVASGTSLAKTAECFAEVGTTSLLLTKLDEASSLGGLLPLLRASRLPLSYLTHGQNVPDDIAPADSSRLARTILGVNW